MASATRVEANVSSDDKSILDGNNNANDNNNSHHNLLGPIVNCDSDDAKSKNGSDIKSRPSSSPPSQQLSSVQCRQSLGYLEELLNEREKLKTHTYGNVMIHVNRLLEDEIQRVRATLIHIDGASNQRTQLELPEPSGQIVQRSRKLFVPVDKYPEMNFIGRIIGPRGLTIRELEVDCGCKLYIRGKGSLRDKEKEAKCRGQANWEHLSEDLHVLICAEDTEARAEARVEYAAQQINKLIESVISNEDDFKKRQLAELAILNDSFKISGNGTLTSASAATKVTTTSPPLGTAMLPSLSMMQAASLLAPLGQNLLQQQQQHNKLISPVGSTAMAFHQAQAVGHHHPHANPYLNPSLFGLPPPGTSVNANHQHLLTASMGLGINPYVTPLAASTGNPLFDVYQSSTLTGVAHRNAAVANRYQPYSINAYQSNKNFKK